LVSLDALRGFDMFWIVGGGMFLRAVVAWIGWEPLKAVVAQQTEHVGWDGFVAWDLIFPLFVFMSGVSMPFSLLKKLEQGESKRRLYGRLFRRMLLLVFLGMVQSLLQVDWSNTRLFSVLALIGVSNFLGGMIVIHRPPRGQLAWALGLLIGYWLALSLIPVPGVGPGVITPGGVLGGYIDRNLVPGKFYLGVIDPEGSLNMLPATAMVLLGALSGHWLRRSGVSGLVKVAGLLAGGAVLLLVGNVWGHWFPVIKSIWSSTFICVAAGWSALLLAAFYLAIDVWHGRWLAFVWIPIGMNAITIYVLQGFVDFAGIAERVFGGLAKHVSEPAGAVVLASGVLVLKWALLYFLYRKKIFLRA
jgi:predicted acyltransferase